jgi:hypothetical protein
MTSYLKKNLGFNILKTNPFKACLNVNGNSNFPKVNKINTIKKNKKKSKIIIDSKANKSYITSPKKKSYISLISTKNTKNSSSLFLDHTFMASKNLVLSKLQKQTLFLNNNTNDDINNNKKSKNGQNLESNKSKEQDINIKSYLEDMKKTLELNLDIISKYCQKDKKIKELINSINNKIKKKEEIKKKIEKIKGAMIIEKQIQSEYIRKKGENNIFQKDQINFNLDKLTMKDEYIIVLLKKLKELEIFSKRKSSIRGSGFRKYKNFKISEFVETNTKCWQQKYLILKEMKEIKINKINIKKENKKIKEEQEKYGENKRKKREENFNKFEKYYKYSCNMMESKIKILKNILNRISKEHLNIKISPKLKRLLETEEEKGENIFEMDFNTKKNYSNKNKKRNLINSISASIDLTNMNNDMTRRLESFIDLSVILNDNKNNEVTNIFDTINHGNIYLKKADFANISKMK